MKPFFAFLMLCALLVAPALRAQEETADDRYVRAYNLMLAGDAAAEKGQTAIATAKYAEAQTVIKQLKKDYPDWNVKLMDFRSQYLMAKLAQPAKSGMAAPADAGKPVDLRLKWNVGKRYVQDVKMTQDSEISLPNVQQTAESQTIITMNLGYSVLAEREGGGSEVELELISLGVEAKTGGRTAIKVDSKDPEPANGGNPLAGALRKLAGGRVKLLVDAAGKVESVEGADELAERAKSSDANGPADLAKMFTSEKGLKTLGSLGSDLPKMPVRIGDTWMQTKDMPAESGGVLVRNVKLAFTGWEDLDKHKCVVIESAGDILPRTDGTSPAADAPSVQSGKYSRKTWFDPELGMVIASSDKEEMSLKISASGQSMTTRTRGSGETKLVSVTDLPRQ